MVFFLYSNFMANTETNNTLWGQDIALDDSNSPKVAANGEFILTSGVETALQDIKLRLFTRLGSLFYDKEYGSLIHDFIFEESTESNRSALLSEIIIRIEKEPRVVFGSVSASILSWDEKNVSVDIRFTLVGEDSYSNLLLRGDSLSRSFVIDDCNPTDDASSLVL